MNILVTGGLGFIGSNFINYWGKKYPEDKIINLDKETYASNRNNVTVKTTLKVGDICDSYLVDMLCRNVDLIVHFAAESHVDNSISSPHEFVETNVMGTFTLLESARKYGIRFHHVSTDEVFGSLELDDSKFTRHSPYNPRNPYSATKASSDHLVRAYFNTYKLPVTISNCSNNYGMNQHVEKLIPKAINTFLNNGEMGIYGTGVNVRDWIFVTDHVKGIEKAILFGKMGETYLFGGTEHSNLQIMDKLKNIIGKGSIKFIEDRKGHDLRYAIDWEETQKELDWYPETNIDDGLKETVRFYEERNIASKKA